MAVDSVVPLAPVGGSASTERAEFSWSDPFQRNSYFALLGMISLLTYSFWNMLAATSEFWKDDQYSHGYLVPLIAVYLLWSMRPNPAAQDPPEGQDEATFLDMIPASQLRLISAGAAGVAIVAGMALEIPFLQGLGVAIGCVGMAAYVLIGQPFQRVPAVERWAGLALLLAAYGVRVYAASIYMEPLNRLSFIAAMLGGFLLIGGLSLLRWAGASVGFLVFMFPLPTEIEGKLLLNLQKVAAVASEVVLTILNQPVVREGNKIFVDGIPLEVAEACSGLRMVTIFGGFAVACALLIRRPWWDRLIVLLSAIPIALIANIARIVTTALMYRLFPDGEAIHQVIHDYAGFAMMPLALGLIYLELKVLKMLSVEEEGVGEGGYGAQNMLGV